MKLFEYMGKELFKKYGVPVPKGQIVYTSEEAFNIAEELGSSVLKVQTLTGKRGKSGGILFADSPDEARQKAEILIGSDIDGYRNECILIERKLDIEKELYLAITNDGVMKSPILLASTEGGVDIEEVTESLIIKMPINISIGLRSFIIKELFRKLGLPKELFKKFDDLLHNLYQLYLDKDANLVEINPLVVSGDHLLAADAKVTIDDDAHFRQSDLSIVDERTDLEKKAHELGLVYIELKGDIAIIANGAGMGMATLDTLKYFGGEPANFLDFGGGAGADTIANALKLVLESQPKVIFVNIFGGLTRCDDVAKAFAMVKKEHRISTSIVFRMAGTNEELGVEILNDEGMEAYSSLQEAAGKAVKLASL